MSKRFQPRKNLTELASWASFAVQLVGYFPLTTRVASYSSPPVGKEKKLKTFRFSWAGFLPYYSILLTTASFTWCFVYFLRYKDFKAFTKLKSGTEVTAYNLMTFTSTLSGLYMKLFPLIKHKQLQHFWECNEILFEKFQITPEFQTISSSGRIHFIWMSIPVICHIAYFYVARLIASILDDWHTSLSNSLVHADTQLYMGLTFWMLFALLHVGNSIWLNFFAKYYTKCLLSIAEDLRNLKEFKKNAKIYRAMHSVDEGFRFERPTDLQLTLDKLNAVDHEISRFNGFFGNVLFFEVANCVMNLLVFSFFACLWMGRGEIDKFGETLVPMYLYGKELFDMGTAAEDLTSASEDVLNSIAEDLDLGHLSEEKFLRIQMIAVQLCTKPPVISARQFFTINRSLVTSVTSAIATFLVVLVQFREQDDAESTPNVSNPGPLANISVKS